MTNTEHTSKTPRTATGIFALLGSLPRCKGTGTPKITHGTGLSKPARARLLTLVLLVSTLGVLFPAAPGADAATGYASLFHFTSPEGFSGPLGLAVDGSADSSKGDVYVVDQGNKALKKFTVSGEAATQEWSADLPGSSPFQATVDDFAGPDEGDVFVAGEGSGVIYRVNPGGTEVVEVLTGLSAPTAVAVDSAGDFFVASIGEEAVLEYNAKWEPIDAAGMSAPLPGENKVIEGLGGVLALAVDPTGEHIYAATEGGTFDATLVGGSYVASGTFDPSFSAGVTVAPSGDVFVDQGGEVAFYEPSGTLLGTFGSGVLSGEAFGVAVSPADAYVADHAAGDVDVFEAGPTPETPEVSAASSVTGTSAVLNGKLNLGAGETTLKYFFEYAAGGSCEGGIQTPVREGSGNVSEQIGHLSLLTAYTFCLHVENKYGTTESAPVIFETVAVGSEDSLSVTATEAILAAAIDTSEEATTYQVQYGTTSVTEHTTPEPAALTPASATLAAVKQVLKGLTPATIYSYRFIASNARGTATGEERTFTTPASSGATAETCPNAARRVEQPDAATLPDCRAYELVSPAETNGQDATHEEVPGVQSEGLRASVGGDALAYESPGVFGHPAGSGEKTEYLSRRASGGWMTQPITPLQELRYTSPGDPSYESADFTPELTAGVATAGSALAGTGAPETPLGASITPKLYLAKFGEAPDEPSYTYIGELQKESQNQRDPMGASTDLSHVVFGVGNVSEWANGTVRAVGVNNNNGGEPVSSSAGTETLELPNADSVDTWHAVSSDGSRVYFTSPGTEETPQLQADREPTAQLYVRVHAEQPQSEIASPEVDGTGTLTKGSVTVTALQAAAGTVLVGEGTKLEVIAITGQFVVGDPISGARIQPGTTITAVTDEGTQATLRLSAEVTEEIHQEDGERISSSGPKPFAVGQPVTGDGIPQGTTITAEANGTLTVSQPAASSGSGVELRAGGGCTVSSQACTIDVSASQRLAANPAGIQSARFWGASTGAEGGPEKVFFMSDAELTEDAYTGPHGEGANLYEYELAGESGQPGRLTDLTADDKAGDGAAVQGVVQLSEDGSHVYFVAKGALTGAGGETLHNGGGEAPQQGEPNLYLSHDGGIPDFIATLSRDDEGDWNAGPRDVKNVGGPGVNTAALDPSGTRLAFSSERSLTGYDNEQAAPGECEAALTAIEVNEGGACRELYLYDAETDTLACASCRPTRARPRGPSTLGESPGSGSDASYRRRNFSESGVLFFDSFDALAAGTAGGVENVYEYENERVLPISHVASGEPAFLLDASATGDDVFFATTDQLVTQDSSENLVIYDARVDGGFPTTSVPPPCGSEACRAPATPPPIVAAPTSATYAGPGNPPHPATTPVKPKTAEQIRLEKLAKALKACRKKNRGHKRALCEKRARKTYAKKASAKPSSVAKKPSSATRAGNDRGARS